MTKERIILIVWCVLTCHMLTMAQIKNDGFYRVRNYGSDRYIFIADKFGSYDMKRDIGDFGALELWNNKDVVSNVSSIIYISNKGANAYDLQGQGTGIYKLISRYVNVYETTSGVYKGTYQVYATESGVTKYLTDNETSDVPDGILGTSGTGAYRQWEVLPVSPESEDNYFGITPNVQVGEKYYYPMFASFSFEMLGEGMKAYVVKSQEGYFYLHEITGTIPEGTPVIIECTSPNASDNRINLLKTNLTPDKDNCLSGTYFCCPKRETLDQNTYDKNWYPGIAYDASTMRTLGITKDGKLGLVDNQNNLVYFKKTNKYYLPANQAYLTCSATAAGEFVLYQEGDVPSAVERMKATSTKPSQCTDLSGRILKEEPARGLFIRDGKLQLKR